MSQQNEKKVSITDMLSKINNINIIPYGDSPSQEFCVPVPNNGRAESVAHAYNNYCPSNYYSNYCPNNAYTNGSWAKPLSPEKADARMRDFVQIRIDGFIMNIKERNIFYVEAEGLSVLSSLLDYPVSEIEKHPAGKKILSALRINRTTPHATPRPSL